MQDRLDSKRCSQYMKALSDPERLKIVQCLRGGGMAVGELAARLKSPLANVSHHLKQLRAAGLVASEKRGRIVYCTLAPKVAGDGKSRLNVLDFGCCRLELGKRE